MLDQKKVRVIMEVCPNPASRKFDVWLQLPRQMRILLGKYVHGGQKNLQWEGNLPT